jgi:OOP family OmpA-OmpF porin
MAVPKPRRTRSPNACSISVSGPSSTIWHLAVPLLLAVCVVFPAELLGQGLRPGWEAGPFGGVLAFDRNFRVSDGVGFRSLKESPVFGGRLGYALSRRISVEGAVSFSSHSLDPSSQAGSASLDISYLTYTAEALAMLAAGQVVPFVAAGFGGLSLQVDADVISDESSSGLFASIGGGIKVPLSPKLLARLDARDFIIRSSGRGVESLFGGEGEVRHNIGLSGGISVSFGGPGDEDRDGVYDDRDACPGTLADAPVDETGCIPKIPEGPPPVKTDGDGDGVSDALDRCPDSPPGAVVDLEGCPVGEEGMEDGVEEGTEDAGDEGTEGTMREGTGQGPQGAVEGTGGGEEGT